ncbi:MAG: hypothetical protein QE271_03435 [Bacteriovoracaceae bacterium]|nr:hypothetical protein [Bacteriovoracaceae bacterium]
MNKIQKSHFSQFFSLFILMGVVFSFSFMSESFAKNLKKKTHKATTAKNHKKKVSKVKLEEKPDVAITSEKTISLSINPMSENSLDPDLMIQFSVTTQDKLTEDSLKDAMIAFGRSYPRKCVVELPLLSQNPKYYLGNSSVFVSQSDLKGYGISDTDNSLNTTMADTKDIQSLMKTWDQGSRGISFSEIDSENMKKFIDQLVAQLNSTEHQECIKKIEIQKSLTAKESTAPTL